MGFLDPQECSNLSQLPLENYNNIIFDAPPIFDEDPHEYQEGEERTQKKRIDRLTA